MSYEPLLTKLRADVAAASPRPWKPGPPELLCESMLSTEDGEYICEFYTTTIATEDGTLPGVANARLAALDGPALLESLLWAQEAIAWWIPNPSDFDEAEIALIGDRRADIRKAISDAAKALGVEA